MSLDIAMGGSTNTILHLLAAAEEGGVDFTMKDIDELSRRVPNLCKVAPSVDQYHVEDVHRAGGIPAIMGELARGGIIDTSTPLIHSNNWDEALAQWDIALEPSEDVKTFWRAGPAGIPTQVAFSQATRWDTVDDDRENGCIRSAEHAYSSEGGLAVLFGNLAEDGCIVKTAGVDESIWKSQARPASTSHKKMQSKAYSKRSRRARSSSSATKAPKGARACKRCSTQPPTSRAVASARSAHCSPTVVSRAEPPDYRSATSRQKLPMAA